MALCYGLRGSNIDNYIYVDHGPLIFAAPKLRRDYQNLTEQFSRLDVRDSEDPHSNMSSKVTLVDDRDVDFSNDYEWSLVNVPPGGEWRAEPYYTSADKKFHAWVNPSLGVGQTIYVIEDAWDVSHPVRTAFIYPWSHF